MRTTSCPSEYKWTRYHTNQLSQGETNSIALHIEKCAFCAQRAEQRKEVYEHLHNQDFFHQMLAAENPFLQRPKQQDRKPAQPKPTLWDWIFGQNAFALSAVAACILILLPQFIEQSNELPETTPLQQKTKQNKAKLVKKSKPAIRKSTTPEKKPKGMILKRLIPSAEKQVPQIRLLHKFKQNRLSFYTKDGQTLAPGDLIQFDYRTPHPIQLMIASINEKGEISVFAPPLGTKSTPITQKEGTLPNNSSLELDDYIGKELFVIAYQRNAFTAAFLKQELSKVFSSSGSNLLKMKEKLTKSKIPTLRPLHIKTLLVHKNKRDQ